MVCPNCGLNNRQRFLLGEALKKSKKYKNCKIYIYEQVTVCYQKIKSIYPNTIGSEYFGSEYESGTLVNGILHEDSAELSFPENSFDLILSLDVFEHVFDLEKSFKEAFRVLKPSGQMIFSVPYGSFLKGVDITQKRAEIIDGNIVYIKETQYHGNPISDKGSLVVYNIAWDCLEMLKSVGFSDIHLTAGYNRMTGNIGLLQFFFEAIKQ
jgi:SAM-dependent methyltransferase